LPVIIINPKTTNNRTNGNNTNNQANVGAPPLQIIFNNQVQNNIYKTFITKIMLVFVTSHEYEPKQYVFTLPKFCNDDTINPMTDITKYTYAGSHNFFNPTISIIY